MPFTKAELLTSCCTAWAELLLQTCRLSTEAKTLQLPGALIAQPSFARYAYEVSSCVARPASSRCTGQLRSVIILCGQCPDNIKPSSKHPLTELMRPGLAELA